MDTINVKKDLLRIILSYFSNIVDKQSTKGNSWAVRNVSVSQTGAHLTGNVETPTAGSYTGDLTIAAGAKYVEITTNATYAGNILGVAGVASTVYRFVASTGNTLDTIAITRTAGGFVVTKVV